MIEYLIDGIAAGRDWHSVKGNHDIELPRLLKDEGMSDPPNPPLWTEELNHGAETTLASYGIRDARSLPLTRSRTGRGVWFHRSMRIFWIAYRFTFRSPDSCSSTPVSGPVSRWQRNRPLILCGSETRSMTPLPITVPWSSTVIRRCAKRHITETG